MEQKKLIEHYSDFRQMVISSLIFYTIMFVIMFIAVRWLLPFLIDGRELVMLGPLDVIKLYVTLAGILALGLSIPYLGWQLWGFFSSALTLKERKLSLSYIPAIAFCFVLGLSFGYFIVYPLVYGFLIQLGETHFSMMITASEYVSFLLLTTLPFGFLFELPLFIMLLATLGIVDVYKLKKGRKYAYLVLVALSVLITPPDFVSDILVIVPLIILYEIGLVLANQVEKRKRHELMPH